MDKQDLAYELLKRAKGLNLKQMQKSSCICWNLWVK